MQIRSKTNICFRENYEEENNYQNLNLFIIWSVVIFCVGFSWGNIRADNKAAYQYLKAAEELFKTQGDRPAQINASLELMRANKLSELGGVKRQFFSIYLPSLLIIINIIITVVLKNVK